jgi:hypothetical protein
MKPEDFGGIFTAEDLWLRAVCRKSFFSLLRSGVRKSLLVPVVAAQFSVRPSEIAFLDDRLENIRDMASSGVGLNMLAPRARIQGNNLVSFDLDSVLREVLEWSNKDGNRKTDGLQTEIPAATRTVGNWCHTGLFLHGPKMQIFNRLRSTLRKIRSANLTHPHL